MRISRFRLTNESRNHRCVGSGERSRPVSGKLLFGRREPAQTRESKVDPEEDEIHGWVPQLIPFVGIIITPFAPALTKPDLGHPVIYKVLINGSLCGWILP